jgi:hypothetical protein
MGKKLILGKELRQAIVNEAVADRHEVVSQ